MPLSDREQQILQDIERQLVEQDPKFARDVTAGTQAGTFRSIRAGLALFVVGLGVLLAFFFHPLVLIGVGAFLLMVSGATISYQNLKKAGADKVKDLRRQASLSGLVGRFEGRLRDIRKRDDN
jgi:membrane-bound ClpP family serine protease